MLLSVTVVQVVGIILGGTTSFVQASPMSSFSLTDFITGTKKTSKKIDKSESDSSESDASATTPRETDTAVIPVTIDGYKILGKIAVGSPKEGTKEQMLKINFNVQSPFTWILSAELCGDRNCVREPFQAFDGLNSVTYKEGKKTVNFVLPTGDFRARVSKDQFQFGLNNQADLQFLEVIEKEFPYDGFDGNLGLDLRKKGKTKHQHSVFGLLAQHADPVFGMHFHRMEDRKYGNFVVGGKDDRFREEPLNSHNVQLIDKKLRGWNINIDKVVVIYPGGERKEHQLSVKTAVPTPSIDEITLPATDYHKLTDIMFEKATFVTEGMSFFCNIDRKLLPSLALVMDGQEYVLAPDDYAPDYGGANICRVSVSMFENKVKLGRTFMRKFYTRFNIGTKQVQFAKAKQAVISGTRPSSRS